MHAKSPAILTDCRAFLYTVPPKLPGQSCAAPRRRQLLMQSREAVRRRPLRLSGKAEEAVRKNHLSGGGPPAPARLRRPVPALYGPASGAYLKGRAAREISRTDFYSTHITCPAALTKLFPCLFACRGPLRPAHSRGMGPCLSAAYLFCHTRFGVCLLPCVCGRHLRGGRGGGRGLFLKP